jgi:hypothetical protein
LKGNKKIGGNRERNRRGRSGEREKEGKSL